MGLRLFLVTDHYPPFIGGGHRQSQLLARELSQRGHQVSVATVWHPGLPDQEHEDFGVRVYRLKQLRTWGPLSIGKSGQQHQPPFPDPVSIRGMRRLIDRIRPDVVHSYGWITYSIAVALLGNNIPLLISVRDYGYGCATRTLLFQGQHCNGPALTKCLRCASNHYSLPKGTLAAFGVLAGRPLLRRRVSGIHSISRFTQEITHRDLIEPHTHILETNGGRILTRVIPSFREDVNDVPPTPGFLERLPVEPYILFVGALQPRKGVTQLLAAYRKLESPPPLVLVGYVDPKAPVEIPPEVIVIEDVPHADVMAAWEHCLFGVAPSLWPEPLGGVVHEAMSKGKAAICTKPGGHADMIIDHETGLLVPAGDVDALAQAMQRLIDDAPLREQLGAAAREHAKRFTAEAVIPQFEALYRELAAQRTLATA